MENKLKHLEFIQAVINRMANTSFLLKGWSITIIAGLSAFSGKDDAIPTVGLALGLTLVFWFLDAYFLRQERLFRSLYDHVRTRNEDAIDFSMDATSFRSKHPFYATPFSLTLWPFYGAAIIAILVVFVIRLAA